MLNDFNNNNILICNNYYKKKLLNYYHDSKRIVDFKILSLAEFIENMTFKYDTKTIYYVMHKLNIKYEIAIIYLQNLIYVNQEYKEEKLKFLYELKKDLEEQKLIQTNTLFKKFARTKKIIFYNINHDLVFLKHLCQDLDIEFINDKSINKYDKTIYHFNTIHDEIVFVARRIIDLLNQNVAPSNIKLVGVSNEYLYPLNIIFSFHNLCVNTQNSSIYSSEIGSFFINNLKENITETINLLKQKYQSPIVDDIISICNNYTWCNNFLTIKELLINDLKHCKIKPEQNSQTIEIIDYFALDISSDNYYFLMGFNNENIPITYKDIDYISDDLCDKVYKETSNERFIRERNTILKKIQSTKNLVITYKDKTYFREYLPSNLIDELGYKTIDTKIDVSESYSILESQIRLAKLLDLFDKYATTSKELAILYNNIESNYKTYDNNFNRINLDDLYEYLNNQLLLSYSSIDNYYECAFKYYINNILKIDEFKNSFSTYIGSLMHYILSICKNQDFNLEEEFNNYIINHDYPFTNQDKYFLTKIQKYLEFIIKEIDNQKLLTGFNNEIYEQQFYLEKENKIKITLVGIIDKIMFLEKDGKKYISIIDYKTGKINTSLKNIKYGLSLQLPIYAYLVKNSQNNYEISGLYYQKLLDSDIKATTKEEYEKCKRNHLKLEGYSTNNESILEIFDSTYQNSELIKNMKTTSKGFYQHSKIFSASELEATLELTEEKINEAIEAIVNGEFVINPKKIKEENVSCRYCKYKDLCFMNENNVIVLEEGDEDDEMDE